MAHFDRGVYEPSDDARVFDGTEDDEDVEGSRLPLLIVLALLVLAVFAGVVWLAYTQGVARGRTETPVLTAENGPARVAPQNPGGVEQPYKGFKIYEQPAPPDEDADVSTTPPASPAAKAAAPTPKVAAATPAPAPAKPAAIAKSELPPPMAKPLPVGPATAAPRSLALTPAKPVAAPAAPVSAPAAPAAADGAYVLQIGAYKSQADADTAWNAYKTKHAALLSGASNNVQQADLGDKGTWYRLRIVGFPSKDVASAMCDRLKADGGTCFLGK